MNNPVFVWINDIKLSASLPTANCEFISSKRIFKAITSTAIARNCYISNGPALMALSNDYQDNIVVCAIQSISTRCTKSQYHQLVNFVHDHNENLVGRFLRLIGLVTMEEFKPFIDFILDNERVLRLFMNSEASFKHHHCTQGGLFEHSIEVAEMTYQNAKHLGHSDVECQTGLVAALFHDIGKIYPALQMNSDKYHAGTHERYAFALLAKPLGELGTINSRVFSMLCELLAAKPYGHKTRYPIEHVLKQADRTSAESNFAKLQFKALPPHYYFTKVNGNIMY